MARRNDTIALIDYRAGNLTSVRKGFAAIGEQLYTPASPADLEGAEAIVVPGVGHFNATASLDDEWRTAIKKEVFGGTPLLGICLGLQWLFEGSDEAPELAGLGLLKGQCFRLPSSVKVPHVGWNSLEIAHPAGLLDGIPDGTQVYFTHSYAAPVTADCLAGTSHGATFAAAVQGGSTGVICGVQFHPEKSGEAGLRILRNFIGLM